MSSPGHSSLCEAWPLMQRAAGDDPLHLIIKKGMQENLSLCIPLIYPFPESGFQGVTPWFQLNKLPRGERIVFYSGFSANILKLPAYSFTSNSASTDRSWCCDIRTPPARLFWRFLLVYSNLVSRRGSNLHLLSLEQVSGSPQQPSPALMSASDSGPQQAAWPPSL